MGLVTPAFGLLFWMVVCFSLLVFILRKFAWKPILAALTAREDSIEKALQSADLAKKEMLNLQAGNEKLLKEAVHERERIVKEARDIKDSILRDAKTQAVSEASKILEEAKISIERERTNAIEEMKSIISSFSLEIAEKILKSELDNTAKQKELVNRLMNDIKLN